MNCEGTKPSVFSHETQINELKKLHNEQMKSMEGEKVELKISNEMKSSLPKSLPYRNEFFDYIS